MLSREWPEKVDALLVLLDTLHPYRSDSLMKELSGFTGSAGTLLKRRSSGVLMTDSRYVIQAQKELAGKDILVHEHDKNLNLSGVVGADPRCISFSTWSKWQRCVEAQGGELCALDLAEYKSQIYPWCAVVQGGRSFAQKRETLLEELRNSACDGILLTCPELISWILNVREPARPYVPYCDVRAFLFDGEKSIVFVGEGSVENAAILQDVSVFSALDENALYTCMQGKVWAAEMSKMSASMAQWMLKKELSVQWSLFSSLQHAKAVKDVGELEHMKQKHLCEAEALIQVLSHVRSEQSESDIAQNLEKERSKNPLYWGPSFPTISACGRNSKIVHYRPGLEENALGNGAFLLDAGGQYEYATTDMTRSLFLMRTCQTLIKMIIPLCLKPMFLWLKAFFL